MLYVNYVSTNLKDKKHHPIIPSEFHRYNKNLPFKSWQQMESVKKQKNKDPQQNQFLDFSYRIIKYIHILLIVFKLKHKNEQEIKHQ